MAAGLPVEGEEADTPRLASVAHPDVPRCGLEETLDTVAPRLGEWELIVVTADDDVVMGVVPADVFAAGGDGTRLVGDVMHEAPSTFRPDVPVANAGEMLRSRKLDSALVTTNDGALVGLVRAADLPPA